MSGCSTFVMTENRMKCIVYIPYKLEESGRARMIRPRKMAQAFRDIGYEVELISGVSSERRSMIRDVKQRIAAGEKYDFLYMESNTEPTLLTDPHHLPTHPFLDYGFLKFVRSHGIPVGLFYCDMFWKYDFYGTELPAWKKQCALACYRYDIRQYEKLLNIFYCPNAKVFPETIGSEKLGKIAKVLLPGAEDLPVPGASARDFSEKPLTVFYVGGITRHYRIEELLKAVQMTEGTKLILCCRKDEWESERKVFEPYLCGRMEIVHKSGAELEELYAQADLSALMFQPNAYMGMTVPFKTFEYLAHELPVLATRGTVFGEFTEDNGIGWNIENDAAVISEVLQRILAEPGILPEKRRKCAEVKKENLWTARAEQVAGELMA